VVNEARNHLEDKGIKQMIIQISQVQMAIWLLRAGGGAGRRKFLFYSLLIRLVGLQNISII